MFRILHTLFIIGLGFHLLFGEEIFIDQNSYRLAHRTLSEKYCKHTSKDHTFCESRELGYLDCDDPDLPAFLKGSKAHIAPVVEAYRRNDTKHAVLSDLKDLGDDMPGEWYNNSTIDLFSKTDSTYTLSTISNGYSGGAHGYYGIHFDNYSIASQKRLTLDDLFVKDYSLALTNIAQKHYRHTRGLKPGQALTEDGWFENKFVLAENFALTPRGIYFYYNSYEIKSYADGHTTFLLPYYKLKSIIDPKGSLSFALQQAHTLHADFQDAHMKITLDTERQADRITVAATMTSADAAKQGWLSVSLPQVRSKNLLIGTYRNTFDHLIPYDRHNRIYNVSSRKTMKAKYLLVEADKKEWGYGETCGMKFTFFIPKGIKELALDVRGTLKSDKTTYTLPDAYEQSITGQQGYHNYRIFLEL